MPGILWILRGHRGNLASAWLEWVSNELSPDPFRMPQDLMEHMIFEKLSGSGTQVFGSCLFYMYVIAWGTSSQEKILVIKEDKVLWLIFYRPTEAMVMALNSQRSSSLVLEA
ncbi:hypothetical protein VNO77_03542 [Canavalia gladiata]|uniref:Uncharacterized protein n=1 Tax=Canavalia gladiata TaxID=3824 RepID=A0AAN9R402_CANGL